MIPLESRIESAVAAAAAEITPADIPELRLPEIRLEVLSDDGMRLPGARNGRAELIRLDAQPERRRWLAPLAAAVSVAAVLVGMVFVGHAPWSERGGTWPESATLSRAQRLLAK